MLGKRVVSAVVLIPIVGAGVYAGGFWLLALVGLAGLLAGHEFVAMMGSREGVPSHLLVLLLIALFVVGAQWPDLILLRCALGLVSLAALAAKVFGGNASGSLESWALTVAGAAYVGFPLGCFVRLRAMDQGMWWMVLALLGTWISDSGAYFVGCGLGKHKLCPRISPKKTWEGVIGGLVSGVVTVVLLGRFLLGLDVGWGIVLGVLLVLGATIGDLAESVIKRQAETKDSGNLIPGHGGMLDRLDSLLFIVPIVYCFASLATRFLF